MLIMLERVTPQICLRAIIARSCCCWFCQRKVRQPSDDVRFPKTGSRENKEQSKPGTRTAKTTKQGTFTLDLQCTRISSCLANHIAYIQSAAVLCIRWQVFFSFQGQNSTCYKFALLSVTVLLNYALLWETRVLKFSTITSVTNILLLLVSSVMCQMVCVLCWAECECYLMWRLQACIRYEKKYINVRNNGRWILSYWLRLTMQDTWLNWGLTIKKMSKLKL